MSARERESNNNKKKVTQTMAFSLLNILHILIHCFVVVVVLCGKHNRKRHSSILNEFFFPVKLTFFTYTYTLYTYAYIYYNFF